jgi:UDP-glucose:(heptosyl)LPS alpha-1,3-glucosyltransferase
MRVAIVQQQVDVRRGGAETSTLEMARHLARLGSDVTIVCPGRTWDPFVDENVTFLPVITGRGPRALRTYRFLQGVRELCRHQRFDIVHAVTPCLSANVYQPRGGTYPETLERSLAPVRSPLLRGLKRLGRRFNVRQQFLLRIERVLLGKYRGRVFVAAVSDYVARQVQTGLGFPPDRIRVVFNGVDISPLTAEERGGYRAALRAELDLAGDAPLVLFAAHNFRLKGLAELVRATAAGQSGRGGAWVVAVAGRDDPGRYRRLARRLGVESRLRFVGTRTPIRGWYAAADALAHPTWYDPCSRVVLEALSLGLPVVTTRYNGAAEMMQAGRHGEIVDEPSDIARLAAALARTLDPTVRRACQADVPRLAKQLSMARHARELVALYHQVLASQ